jgi:hypothetical protein
VRIALDLNAVSPEHADLVAISATMENVKQNKNIDAEILHIFSHMPLFLLLYLDN